MKIKKTPEDKDKTTLKAMTKTEDKDKDKTIPKTIVKTEDKDKTTPKTKTKTKAKDKDEDMHENRRIRMFHRVKLQRNRKNGDWIKKQIV